MSMTMSTDATRSNEKMIDAVKFAMAARQLEILSRQRGPGRRGSELRKYQQHYLDEALHYQKLGIRRIRLYSAI